MRKLTHEQFLEKLSNVNPNIEVLGTYVKMTVKIKCRCKIDGYIWDVIPNSLMRGLGCPKCAGNNRKTHEEFVAQMHEINPNIEVEYLTRIVKDLRKDFTGTDIVASNYKLYQQIRNGIKIDGLPKLEISVIVIAPLLATIKLETFIISSIL